MGLFRSLFKRLLPPEIDDEFFGRLIYMKMPKDRDSYWEARCVFSPTGTEVNVFIDAPAPMAAPNDAQRKFFRDVVHDYGEIQAVVAPVLQEQLESWARKPMTRAFADEFTLVSFSIPVPSAAEPEWELSFDNRTDENHMFTIQMRGRSPGEVTIDG